MRFGFLDPWHRFLPSEGGHVLTAFGGGGKTSLLRELAALYRKLGVPVLATTTTRTEPLSWPDLSIVDWHPELTGRGDLSAATVFVRDGTDRDGKWLGIGPRRCEELGRAFPDRIVLVEADGSGGLPVKLHRPDEPVWPRLNSVAFAVIGLAAIGRSVGEVLHRFGRLRASWLGEVGADAEWTWDLTFGMLAGAGGYLERVPPGVPVILALTQTEQLEDSIGLFEFVDKVMAEAHVPLVMFCELERQPAILRTAYLAEETEPSDGG
jgi:probable selenium-dependent hydroxylase accessory protein YqeC